MAKLVKEIHLPYMVVFDRLYNLIPSVGYAISEANPQTGVIKFDAPVNAMDWGFFFMAQVGALGPEDTQIYFTGHPKFGFDLFGRGNKKLEQMMKKF